MFNQFNITERAGKNFIKLSADLAFSFLGIGSKTKTRNWRKAFYNMFYHKLGFPNFKQKQQSYSKVAYVHMPDLQLVYDLFLFRKEEATIPIYNFKTK